MLGAFKEYVVGEIGAIWQAPVTFVFALAVLGIVIWRMIAWRYSGTVESLNGRLALQSDQIGDYKEKLSGASPDEAKRRIEVLEATVKALSPRRLDEDTKDRLTAGLSQMPGLAHIAQDMSVPDARALTADFVHAFVAAGWRVEQPMVMGIGNPPPSGLGLLVTNPAALTPQEALAKKILEESGCKFDLQAGKRQQDPPPTFNPSGYRPPDGPDVELLITVAIR